MVGKHPDTYEIQSIDPLSLRERVKTYPYQPSEGED